MIFIIKNISKIEGVLKNFDEKKTDFMNPYERRIIHSALQNDRFVITYSEGTDPYRRVVIEYKR